ncbi:uncharacterized protein LOC112343099 [Selaginella moellendorffii]|uniref:uncharacterized protein LOC112343099 n=1 Tax=Selaginella moellendorffii TaxID=88036 RepID=UPI000D1C7C73|nr:uncharacterized protein LOC112343099 [Selaginella moellendorffii]|eukprot:XP_024521765.1 uncharacterized protein LOC112343099 [Selaginella moellendorffii]
MGYARNRDSKLALEFFFTMDREANARSYVTACSGMAGEEQGQEIDGKEIRVLSLEKGMEIHSRYRLGSRSLLLDPSKLRAADKPESLRDRAHGVLSQGYERKVGGLVNIESLEKSMEIHCLAKNHCDQLDLFVGNTLI